MKLSMALGVFASAASLILSTAMTHADSLKFLNDNGSSNVTVTYNLGGGQRTERTAAGSYNFLLNGKAVQGYCTDLADNISNNETFNPAPIITTVSNAVNGLISTWYAKKVNTSQSAVYAIDYISSHYLGTPQSAAAQVAIWDLSVNSIVKDINGKYTYTGDFSASNTSISTSAVYNVEQAALSHDTHGWNSVYAYEGPQIEGRPQDIAFGAPTVPEASTVLGFGGLMAVGGLPILRRRKIQRNI